VYAQREHDGKSRLRASVVAGPSAEELGPLLQKTGGRGLRDMNLQRKEPSGGEGRPPSAARGGAGSKSMSNPWHLLHAMRAMRITSQDPPMDLAETPQLQPEEERSGKVSRRLTALWLCHFGFSRRVYWLVKDNLANVGRSQGWSDHLSPEEGHRTLLRNVGFYQPVRTAI
jgi:hypothetical protein